MWCECFGFLPYLSVNVDGCVFWEECAYLFRKNDTCDFMYHGRRFFNVFDFTNYVMEGEWMSLKISDYIYNFTTFYANFENKINLLVDSSGTGKTFLLQMLRFYCSENNLTCTHVDFIHKDIPLGSSDILLFDKADLYFTSEIFEELKHLDAISVVSIKSLTRLNLEGDIGLYKLINTGTEITVERYR